MLGVLLQSSNSRSIDVLFSGGVSCPFMVVHKTLSTVCQHSWAELHLHGDAIYPWREPVYHAERESSDIKVYVAARYQSSINLNQIQQKVRNI